MRWTWKPFHYPDERTPDAMRELDVRIIEYLSYLDDHFPRRTTSADSIQLRCIAANIPAECASLYPSRKGVCLRPRGAIPKGIIPLVMTDECGRSVSCPFQVEGKAMPKVQVSHDGHAPHIELPNRRRDAILTFLRRTAHQIALTDSDLAPVARYYAPRTLHEHVNGVPVPAPGEASALSLAGEIRKVAQSEKPWEAKR